MENDYLVHYGIKGQRWGVRRFQNRNGSLTLEGKKHYGIVDTVKNKVKEKEQKHRKNLIKHYKDLGYENPEKKAEKRIKLEKKVIAIGATLAIGTAAYVGYKKIGNEYLDKVLKEGTTFHTIDIDKDRDLTNRFYAAYNKKDRRIYRGLLGNARIGTNNKIYDITSKASKNLKIPSRKKAAEVFKDLYRSDKEFKKEVDNAIKEDKGYAFFNTPNHNKLLGKLHKNMTDKELINKAYDEFNINLVKQDSEANKKFYDKLKDLGYNAVIDINDRKYSGYESKNPVIVFDTDSIIKDKIIELSKDEIEKDYRYETNVRLAKDFVKNYSTAIGAIGGEAYVYKKSKKNKKMSSSKTKKNPSSNSNIRRVYS